MGWINCGRLWQRLWNDSTPSFSEILHRIREAHTAPDLRSQILNETEVIAIQRVGRVEDAEGQVV